MMNEEISVAELAALTSGYSEKIMNVFLDSRMSDKAAVAFIAGCMRCASSVALVMNRGDEATARAMTASIGALMGGFSPDLVEQTREITKNMKKSEG